MWRCKILDHILISGKYEELVFGGCDGSFTRVRFFDDTQEWVGVFQNGEMYRIRVHLFDNKAIVMSAGIIYIIDLNERTQFYISEKNDFHDLIADSEQIFCSDSDSIFIMKDSLLVKRIELVYSCDFLFSSMNSKRVYCKARESWSWNDWYEFAIDRNKLEIV